MSTCSRPPSSSSRLWRFSRGSRRPKCFARNEHAAVRRIGGAEFPSICRLETYDFKRQPRPQPAIMCFGLAELSFLDKKQSVLWIGPYGGWARPTWPSTLGVKACQRGYDVCFFRSYLLLTKLYASLADDTLDLLLEQLCKPALLNHRRAWQQSRKPEHDLRRGLLRARGSPPPPRLDHADHTNLGFDQWPQAARLALAGSRRLSTGCSREPTSSPSEGGRPAIGPRGPSRPGLYRRQSATAAPALPMRGSSRLAYEASRLPHARPAATRSVTPSWPILAALDVRGCSWRARHCSPSIRHRMDRESPFTAIAASIIASTEQLRSLLRRYRGQLGRQSRSIPF